MLALLVGASAQTIAAGETKSGMRLTRTEKLVRVTCSREPAWEMELNTEEGGVATVFRLPANGENLVFDSGRFSGLFNLFACDLQKGHPAAAADGGMVKTLIKGTRPVDRVEVLREDDEEVAVEVRGKTMGWRLIGPAGEPVLQYRQRYTFRPRAIEVDGEIIWIYGHNTKPALLEMVAYFAPGAVSWPVRLVAERGKTAELALAGSGGLRMPDGFSHPVAAEVWLRNGRRLRFRSIESPIWNDCRWLIYERPWQTEWAQVFGFKAASDYCGTHFPGGEPIRSRYVMEIPGESVRRPPQARITAPARRQDAKDPDGLYSGLFFRPGETVRFEATAVDADGRKLPTNAFHWEIYKRGVLQKSGAGMRMEFTVPEADDKESSVRLSVTDATGLTGEDYITFGVRK